MPNRAGQAAAGERVLLWLSSRRNLAGSILALAVVVPLLAFSVIPALLGLLLVGLLYAIGVLVAGSGRGNADVLTRSVGLAGNVGVDQALDGVIDGVSGKVSAAVEQRVLAVAATVRLILPRVSQLDAASDEMHIVTRTVSDYLPGTLAPYLAIPRWYAERRAGSDGRTAEALLCEQLDLIDSKLQEVLAAAIGSDLAAIAANGQFLRDRFGSAGLDIGSA